LGTKIDDRVTAEDWVNMAAESVGVTLEMGYLNFEVLESSLDMKAKQARTGRQEEKGLLTAVMDFVII